MRFSLLLSLALVLPLALTGCIGVGSGDPIEEAPLETNADAHEHGAPALGAEGLPGFQLQATDCLEAAGVSVYNSEQGAEGPTEDFVRADISEDVGHPLFGSYMVPITSDHTTGIWHVAATCASASSGGQDLGPVSFGWVGVRVEAPAWDDGTIERQYFVTDLSLSAHQVVEELREEARLHATRMLQGGAEWVAPDTFRMLLDDEVHGVFDSYGTVDQERSTEEMAFDTVRFWLLVPADGTLQDEMDHDHEEGALAAQDAGEMHYRPVAIDIHTTPAPYRIGTAPAYLSHTRTNHHGAAGGAAGNVYGVTLEGMDRTFTLGPVPDVLLEETWLH